MHFNPCLVATTGVWRNFRSDDSKLRLILGYQMRGLLSQSLAWGNLALSWNQAWGPGRMTSWRELTLRSSRLIAQGRLPVACHHPD